MKYSFSTLSEDSLRQLYSIFGFRAKEIGEIVGLSESSILLKLKGFGIPTNDKSYIKKDVDVEFTGVYKGLKNKLTKELLLELCKKGHTDEEVGRMFCMTGEGVAYRRNKFGISLDVKDTPLKKKIDALKLTDSSILAEDYYGMTQGSFSLKYGLSRTVWFPYLKEIGLISKNEHRIASFPPLSLVQKRLVIAGMLGDGGITEDGRYYEFHSPKQLRYLEFKAQVLKPYSKSIAPAPSGFEFETVSHPCFKEYRSLFYSPDFKGKLIPLKVLESLWDDSILAYWFFDDGTFCDHDGTAIFSNLCPIKEQLSDFVSFLKTRYGWDFSIAWKSIYSVFLPSRYKKQFGDLLLKYATPDLYYKIPEECLTSDMVKAVDVDSLKTIRPKFYRVCNDIAIKKKMEYIIFGYYRSHGFPYMNHSQDRLHYLLQEFLDFKPVCNTGYIAHNSIGMNLCENFFPNIYDCSRKGYMSPQETWKNDEYLQKLVVNRLLHADIITDASMRTGIKLTKACVSNFKPGVAKYLYSEYGFNGKILDYSCGFGSRMLAAMSLGMEYCGFEPGTKTFDNLNRFGEFLKGNVGGSFEIRKAGSEEAPFRENYFGFAFSSPPYFDFEKYSDDPGQSLVKFPNFKDWVVGYWKKTMENCYKALIPDGFFGICLSSSTLGDLFDRTFSFAKEIGFHFYKDYTVPFKHVLSGGAKTETVLIFSKAPHISEPPRFYGKPGSGKKFSLKIDDDLMEVSEIERKVCKPEEVDAAVLKFKELAPNRGVSRDTYRDGALLGVPSHVLEHKWGSWNAFVIFCGLAPGYVAHGPVEHAKGFLEACRGSGKVLTFYEYGKISGHPDSRLKRLFNSGRPYHHLLDELKSIALSPSLWPDFLKKISPDTDNKD